MGICVCLCWYVYVWLHVCVRYMHVLTTYSDRFYSQVDLGEDDIPTASNIVQLEQF